MLTISFLKKITGPKLFSVKYTKKSGDEAKMVCRFSVKKGVTGKGMRYNTSEKNYGTVYKFLKGGCGFRTLIVDNILEVKINGVTLSKRELDAMCISDMTRQYKETYSEKKVEDNFEAVA